MVRERIEYHRARAVAEGWELPDEVDDLMGWMVRDRIAHHEAKAREQELARERPDRR